jgi:hypothetical protein
LTMIYDNRRIMGTLFWLFIAPVCALAAIVNRKREPLVKIGEPPGDCEADELCLDCDEVTLHQILWFVDEGGYVSICTVCSGGQS